MRGKDKSLSEVARHKVAEVVYGAGGIGCHAGRFIVVGGLPPGIEENYAYEYDTDFKFVRKHTIQSGYTPKQDAAACLRGQAR